MMARLLVKFYPEQLGASLDADTPFVSNAKWLLAAFTKRQVELRLYAKAVAAATYLHVERKMVTRPEM